MSNIIREIYRGDYAPPSNKPFQTAENKAIINKIENEKRYFVQKMSLDDVQRFDKLEDLYMDFSCFEQENAFICGFKMGMMLGRAVFVDEE